MTPLWTEWTRRLCLALCLALSLACTASATQQRLFIVKALQSPGHPAKHVPQMLMTLHDRAPELPTLDAVVLPTVLILLATSSRTVPHSNFLTRATVAVFAPTSLDPRGPPVLL